VGGASVMIFSSLSSLACANAYRIFFCEQHSENQWQKSNKWQLSRHVESDSTWCDNRQILIGPFPAAAGQSENNNHGGG
jgi:hypothetical protein